MKAVELFNYKREEFETVETFAKRVYETAKRYRKELQFTPVESNHVLAMLSKYYKESASDILSAIRDIEWQNPSEKYRIQWVQCLGEYYLAVEKK